MSDLNERQKGEFEKVCHLKYSDQAKFYLNAFWTELGPKAETVFEQYKKFIELDKQQYSALPEGKKPEVWTEGSSLDEFWSHKFLENIGKTLSVVQFRQEFKKIDANTDKQMGMIEFLIWEHNQSVKELLMRPQGSGDGKELIEAQALLDEVSKTFAEAEKKKNELAAAEAELKSELAKLQEQEEAHAAKTKQLQEKSEGSGVQAMRAKNELAQHLAEDPLPLRKAKLSTEAASKKTERARTAAEHALDQCANRLAEAEAFLKEQMAKGGGPQLGTFYWMDRELQEKKKFMPKSGKEVKLVGF
eukprot:TRINITY_DN2467_c0_g1_i1.p1 TRINITY_DN2467_c0_g1~~TRINITY_DN2467_c0_g1_i1.p1  ORF type:complete len:324 (-),score=69.11 TRINITY_DN2467_c0_g1_i1:109-1017(-)